MSDQTDLQHALHLADIADHITLKYFRSSDLIVTTKPDTTPVTQADLEVEKQLSTVVTRDFKEAYVGEEGTRLGSGSRTWTVDPVDGTKNFARSVPIWATLIALTEDDHAIAAVVSAPALGRRWWAARGQGAWTKDVDGTVRQLHVSGISDLTHTYLLTGSLHSWNKVPTGLPSVIELIGQVGRNRGFGDFLGHMFVAEGAADVCIEPDLKGWDIAAPAIIVREAGGSVWTDAQVDIQPSEPRVVITSNGLLEATVRTALKL
jgi:histidinol-phosphatase